LEDADCKHLETLGFGQTDSLPYLASLSSRPAAMGRPLPSGRFGLTRCFEGNRDQAGRRTLLFATIVFDGEEWYEKLVNQAWALLHAPQVWQDVAKGKLDRVAIPRLGTDDGTLDRDLAIGLLDAWLSPGRGRRKVVIESAASMDATIVGLARLVPRDEARQLGWGVRTLSSSAPVPVQSVATEIGIQGAGGCTPTPIKRLTVPYCQALDLFWTHGDREPVQFIRATLSAFDIDSISRALGTTQQAESSTASERKHPASTRRRLVWIVSVLAVAVLFTAIAFMALSGSERQKNTKIAEQAKLIPPTDGVVSPPTPDDLMARYAERGNWQIDHLFSWISDAKSLEQPQQEEASLSAAISDCRDTAEWHTRVGEWSRQLAKVADLAPSGGSLPERNAILSFDAVFQKGAMLRAGGDVTFASLRATMQVLIDRRLAEARLQRDRIEAAGLKHLQPFRQELNLEWRKFYEQVLERLYVTLRKDTIATWMYTTWTKQARLDGTTKVNQSTTLDLQALLTDGKKPASHITIDWTECEEIARWPRPPYMESSRWSARDRAVVLLYERRMYLGINRLFE